MSELSASPISADPRQRVRILVVAAVCVVVALALLPYMLRQRLEPYAVIFPITACAVAFALYVANRPLYVAFMFWIWFITPFLRRLHDYALGGYREASLIMTAPYLVSAVGILGLWTVLMNEERGVRQAFGLLIVALVYGAILGVATNGLVPMLTDALDWGLPVVVGALLLADWRQYPRYRSTLLRTFTVAMGLIGLYGIYQFFFLPPWDKMWMEGAAISTIGQPYPMKVSVFGPLNAPGSYAIVLMVGLLALFAMKGQGPIWGMAARLAAVPALLGLLLSQKRAGWGGLVIGVVFILIRMEARSRRAVMLYLLLAAVAAVPIAVSYPVASAVGSEFTNLGSISTDASFQARSSMYSSLPTRIIAAPQGGGFGSVGRAARLSGDQFASDSGIVAIVMTFGPGAGIVYLAGFGMLFLWLWREARERYTDDRFVVVSAGMTVAIVSTIVLVPSFSQVQGVCMWSVLGLALASVRYHRRAAGEEYGSAGVLS